MDESKPLEEIRTSEVEANDEPYCKEYLNSVIFGVRKPGEEKL